MDACPGLAWGTARRDCHRGVVVCGGGAAFGGAGLRPAQRACREGTRRASAEAHLTEDVRPRRARRRPVRDTARRALAFAATLLMFASYVDGL